ncbi:hypothetical protein AMK21_18400 [Streptomyces sp. CB00316]|uniref:hypothetical protein n=1 Tax=unclassified Streptomyces TaxID=2593676 RepID=UPI000939FFDA|nr:hypothetical protein [Streptomyces sp. CB00316]OKJ19095.1 hypothetical protein AMK21_18400 [Streptomyces sp. CB00316]
MSGSVDGTTDAGASGVDRQKPAATTLGSRASLVIGGGRQSVGASLAVRYQADDPQVAARFSWPGSGARRAP